LTPTIVPGPTVQAPPTRVMILEPILGTASRRLMARLKAVPVHLAGLSSCAHTHGSISKSSRIALS